MVKKEKHDRRIKQGRMITMIYKKLCVGLCTVCLSVQLSAPTFAAVSASESDVLKVGPGFEQTAEEKSQTPWTKINGV